VGIVGEDNSNEKKIERLFIGHSAIRPTANLTEGLAALKALLGESWSLAFMQKPGLED
jgi:hypothetical protein